MEFSNIFCRNHISSNMDQLRLLSQRTFHFHSDMLDSYAHGFCENIENLIKISMVRNVRDRWPADSNNLILLLANWPGQQTHSMECKMQMLRVSDRVHLISPNTNIMHHFTIKREISLMIQPVSAMYGPHIDGTTQNDRESAHRANISNTPHSARCAWAGGFLRSGNFSFSDRLSLFARAFV